MNLIDLTKTKKRESFFVKKSSKYLFTPKLLKNVSITRDYSFVFDGSNLKNKIIFRCVAQNDVKLDFNVTLTTREEGLANVDAYLEIYILNLDERNNIKVRPFLEIGGKGINFEHKVTIGAPNEKWIKYLNSRGIPRNSALKLISQSFITG